MNKLQYLILYVYTESENVKMYKPDPITPIVTQQITSVTKFRDRNY